MGSDLVRVDHDLAVYPHTRIAVVTAIGAAAILIFNTASIRAMVKHYEEDKEFIYSLDIEHLDAMRQRGRI